MSFLRSQIVDAIRGARQQRIDSLIGSIRSKIILGNYDPKILHQFSTESEVQEMLLLLKAANIPACRTCFSRTLEIDISRELNASRLNRSDD